MIRDNYIVNKVDVVTGFSYHYTGYEIKIWFEGEDMPATEMMPKSPFKEKGIVNKGYSFKKLNEYLNSEKGKEWLGEWLEDRDTRNTKDDIKTQFAYGILNSLSVKQLEKVRDIVLDMYNENKNECEV